MDVRRTLRLAPSVGAAALVWLAVPHAAAQGKPDLAKGQQIATTVCAACHGADGNSTAPVNPKLAGQIPEYLHKQLRNFKAAPGKKAERENGVMAGFAAALSPEDMQNVAWYYAGQKLKPETAANVDSLDLAQKIYRGGIPDRNVPACAGCHGPTGAGMPAQYPRLAGQYAEYTEAQLKAWRGAERANDPNAMMRQAAARLTEGEIKALANYIAGLR